MLSKSVFIVGPNHPVRTIFKKRNFEVIEDTSRIGDADIIVFTGGEDISPHLYGQQRHIKTRTVNPSRDTLELEVFKNYPDALKIGICRGAQLLNALSGGNMWQHVNNHQKNHEMLDLFFSYKVFRVTSSHHQMMVPADDGDVLGVAFEADTFEATVKVEKTDYDPEVIWYQRTKSLCFQPHPEYHTSGVISNPTEEYFFDLVNYFSMDDYDNKRTN